MISPIFNPTGSLSDYVTKIVNESVFAMDSVMPISILKEMSLRAEIRANALYVQAKVEQELAISRRIDSAEEVEIEEYCDTSGKGNFGLNNEGGSISLGLGGEGRRVIKRIIKFNGRAPMI